MRMKFLAIASVIIAAILAVLGLLLRTETSFDGSHFNRNLNAVWVGHRWVTQDASDDEITDLARLLARHGIKYLYVHVGPLQADGTILPSRYEGAGRFVTVARRVEPGLVLLAWVGQIEKSGGGILDLSNPAVRNRVAQTSTIFTAELDFDGIHYDIEPILDGNQDFLDLLRLTREKQLGRNALLSTAAPKWVPDAYIPSFLRLVYRPGAVWTDSYYKEVDQCVDQIAVMAYDTALPWAPAYSLFMKLQTSSILGAVKSAEVLMGVPTYYEPSWGHSPDAENVDSAIKGVVAGLNSTKATDNFAGVAIYPLWETSEEKWEAYRRLWLGR